MNARFLPERDYMAIKAAMRSLVRKCGGPHAAADLTRSDAARLSRYGAAHEAMHAPVDVLADLEAEAKSPDVTRVLADLSGFLLVPKPQVGGEMLDAMALGRLAREQGEALAAFGDALADGEVRPEEAAKLRKEVMDAMAELARLDVALKDLAGLS